MFFFVFSFSLEQRVTLQDITQADMDWKVTLLDTKPADMEWIVTHQVITPIDMEWTVTLQGITLVDMEWTVTLLAITPADVQRVTILATDITDTKGHLTGRIQQPQTVLLPALTHLSTRDDGHTTNMRTVTMVAIHLSTGQDKPIITHGQTEHLSKVETIDPHTDLDTVTHVVVAAVLILININQVPMVIGKVTQGHDLAPSLTEKVILHPDHDTVELQMIVIRHGHQ